jgi:hypothetical protein
MGTLTHPRHTPDACPHPHRTYLLERSRVVHLNSPERNYHIFYQLCYGATPEQKARFRLKPAQEFHYLRQSSCYELPGVRRGAVHCTWHHAVLRAWLAAASALPAACSAACMRCAALATS